MPIGPNEDVAELYRMYMESQPCPTCGAKESEYISLRAALAAANAELARLREENVRLRGELQKRMDDKSPF